ncbi:hypothetical protein [Flavobacterium hibisci]|uniref:hypothetical protein n=1 Tax=Flavobacterium hibisci TaxID=1914462 RepID=UPI001CC01A4B|nr:hypothetical protein [Flavobacterium hibisci]MBZ4041247.1 hypothetical protein [Flavobacterium hibisci]
MVNLIRVKYQTDFGTSKLKSIYDPMVYSGKSMEQTIGAISTNDHICLTATSYNPISGILKEMQHILSESCNVSI